MRLKNSKKRHNISIHALLAESDRPGITRYYPGRNFYPRSPCGERQAGYHKILPRPEFLSTLSLRRATSFYRNSSRCFSNFYPRSPCGERPRLSLSVTAATRFLSTLSLRRATCPKASAAPPLMQFLSTLSLRRATTRPCMRRTVEPDFYPRSPCGERHYFCKDHYAAVSISIHALLAESDHPARHSTIPCGNFYPRSPCGERPSWASMFALTTYISIHALLAESDFTLLWDNNTYGTFLSTLSLRRATGHGDAVRHRERHFYPRSPCGERPQHWPCSQSHHPHFYPRSPCGERRSGAS